MRRYLQFRLKHLFLLTLIVAIACSWATRRIAAMKSFEAIIRQSRGYALIDAPDDWCHRCGIGKLTDCPFKVNFEGNFPGEIERISLAEIGVPFNDETLTEIELFFLVQHGFPTTNRTGYCTADDQTIAELASLDCGTECLTLNCSRFTDRALESLRCFPNLRHLEIGSAGKFTDRGLQSLAACEQLTDVRIDCESSGLTIAGLQSLCHLQSLKSVTANVVVTPDELRALQAEAPGVKFTVELTDRK